MLGKGFFFLVLLFLLGAMVCRDGQQQLKAATAVLMHRGNDAGGNQDRNACSEAMKLPDFAPSQPLSNKNERPTVTMVVLNWSKPSKVLKLVETALNYPTIVTEIILWNNHPKKFPREALAPSSIIRIVDSHVNLMDRSKYEACAMASNPLCLYTDDDYDVFPYLQSMYHAYLYNPTLIHSTTDDLAFYTNEIEWVYDEPSLGLHTRFGWIGCGSLIPRQWAERHLKVLDACVPEEDHILSDVLFMTLTNQYMVQTQVKLLRPRATKEQQKIEIEKPTNIGVHNKQEPLQMQTGEYLIKVANATQGELLAQTPCVTRTLCQEPAVCSLCTNFLPSTPRTGFNVSDIADKRIRTRRNIPHSPEAGAFRNAPYFDAIHGKTDQNRWKTTSLPENAIWGYRSPGNFTLHIRCLCDHDNWSVEGNGRVERGVTLCPSTSFEAVDAIYFHYRGKIGGQFNVVVNATAPPPMFEGTDPKPHNAPSQLTVNKKASVAFSPAQT